MRDHDIVGEAEQLLAVRDVGREEAVLARLDPDRLGTEPPSDLPPAYWAEWREFVALCDRLDAEGL